MPFYDSFNVNGKKFDIAVSLSGHTPPSTQTEGILGQNYTDTTTGTLYVCVSSNDGNYIWQEVACEEITNLELEDLLNNLGGLL